MQALYLAQVCSLRTHVSLCGTRLHERQHRLLVVLGSCGCQGCVTGVARAVEVSTSLQQRPCDLHWPNVAALDLRNRLSNPVSRPDAAEGGTRVRPSHMTCGAVRMCTCHGPEPGGRKERCLQTLNPNRLAPTLLPHRRSRDRSSPWLPPALGEKSSIFGISECYTAATPSAVRRTSQLRALLPSTRRRSCVSSWARNP
jgi:hypothetical protein